MPPWPGLATTLAALTWVQDLKCGSNNPARQRVFMAITVLEQLTRIDLRATRQIFSEDMADVDAVSRGRFDNLTFLTPDTKVDVSGWHVIPDLLAACNPFVLQNLDTMHDSFMLVASILASVSPAPSDRVRATKGTYCLDKPGKPRLNRISATTHPSDSGAGTRVGVGTRPTEGPGPTTVSAHTLTLGNIAGSNSTPVTVRVQPFYTLILGTPSAHDEQGGRPFPHHLSHPGRVLPFDGTVSPFEYVHPPPNSMSCQPLSPYSGGL